MAARSGTANLAALSRLFLLAALSLANYITTGASAEQQEQTRIAIDLDTAGNSGSSLQELDTCRSANKGSTFAVDIVVTGARQVDGFQVRLEFDPTVLEITGINSHFLLGGGGIEAGDTEFPIRTGSWLYAYTNQPPQSGSGVLVRITLLAIGSGISRLSLPLGPLDTALIDSQQSYVALEPPVPAEVHVDGPCPPRQTTPLDSPAAASSSPITGPGETGASQALGQDGAEDGQTGEQAISALQTPGDDSGVTEMRKDESTKESESQVSVALIAGLTAAPLLMVAGLLGGYLYYRRRR